MENSFTNIQPLGSGGFSDVLSAISPQNTEVAIKIIPNESSWQIEERMWPVINHPNILPTLEVMNVDDAGCKLYVMPKHPDTLGSVLRSSAFHKDPRKLVRMKKWFTDVLEALGHLHKRELCHLDVKTDNILISGSDSAILCDFSGLNFTGINLDRFVSPLKYRPPECHEENGGQEIEGVSYDMWAFGMLVFNCLTNFVPARLMGDVNQPNWNWEAKVKRVILVSLQEATFKKLLSTAFRFASISEQDISDGLDFVKGLLNTDPKGRLTVSEAVNHPFLKGDDLINSTYKECLETSAAFECKLESRKRQI